MRTFLIIFSTLLVLGGGFLAYLSFQDPPAKQATKSLATINRPPRAAATTQSVHGIGSGENPWVKRFEKGELVYMFRGERWTPAGGDVVQVTGPEAEFFSGDGTQRLRIEGERGTVVVPGGGEASAAGQQAGSGALAGNASPPTRGLLQDVKISMFEPSDAIEPTLVATMANAQFDNDTFRISTEAYTDASGKKIEADQVPVVVRGRDYDFTGRGLVIRWNQGDRRLQLLEVAHGESLTVKNLDVLSKPELSASPAAFGKMLASADARSFMLLASSAADAPPPAKRARRRPARAPVAPPEAKPKVARDTSPVVYRATFETDVKLFEGPKEVATARRMEIDLLQPPTEDPATKPSQEGATTTRRSRRGRDHADGTTAPAPTTVPAVDGPVTVRWTGKLRVVPLEDGGGDLTSLVPGKPVVRLTGTPATIARDDMTASCGVVSFNAADGSATLSGSDDIPIVKLKLADGANVTTRSVTYVQTPDGKRVATLVGASRAELPAKDGKAPLVLTWNKDGRLQLIETAPGQAAIEKADFAGDVKIVHPDLEMTGQTLSLGFDPSTGLKTATTQNVDAADSLREIVASGDVNCRIRDATAKEQNIASQKLLVQLDRTAAGETYARLLQAEGNVRTNQGSDELTAGFLTAELAPAPATQPVQTVDASDAKPATPFGAGGNVQLVSLVAREKVTLRTADGSTAAAGLLKVETVDARERYILEGDPLATVTQGKTVISGPTIRFSPDEQLAEVIGAGGMKGTLPDDPKESFDIAWAGGAVVNGATNLIDVVQKVVIQSTQADGTVNTATSNKLQARLTPKPDTAPAAAPEADAPAATKPSQADKMNFLAGKEITSATLTAEGNKDVEVKSELFATDGSLLRGLNLWARNIVTNRATGRLEVPVPGTMLYRDYRPPEEKKVGEAAKEGPTLGSGRGNTAFKWGKHLVYDDATKQAVMVGDVEVVHHPQANQKDAQPFNLWADSLTAHLEPDSAAAPAPAQAPQPAGKQPQAKLRVKRVVARGSVRVESVRLNVDAKQLSYDPVAQVLHAIGDENSPITVFDKQQGTTSTVGELEWNTATDQFRVKELSGKVRP